MRTATREPVIVVERLRRQRLAEPIEAPGEYEALFRSLQPVSPIYFSRPGDPPRLVHRTAFDDGSVADGLRAERAVVKGRFLSGTVGYVLASDLELYANAFCRPLPRLDETQQLLLGVLRTGGPATPRQLKEATGLLNKQIMPSLQRLQEAFLVYEDQTDGAWDRQWHDFAATWPAVEARMDRQEECAAEVLRRFLKSQAFATAEQIRDWSGLPSRLLTRVLAEMERDRLVAPAEVEGAGEGWVLAEEAEALAVTEPMAPPRATRMIHRSDPLVRSQASALKRRFGSEEVLQYLLIDGSFQGVVLGHWRIGPYDVDDVAVELPAAERESRREEILAAVAWGYHAPDHRILRYDGAELMDPH